MFRSPLTKFHAGSLLRNHHRLTATNALPFLSIQQQQKRTFSSALKSNANKPLAPIPLNQLSKVLHERYDLGPELPLAIQRKLAEYEQRHDIKILYCVETGSRCYGYYNESSSDFDIRFIYISKLTDYLKLKNNLATSYRSTKTERIPETIQNIYEVKSDTVRSVDIMGWEMRKALTSIRSGNTTILEWLASNMVLTWQSDSIQRLRDIAAKVLHKSPYTVAYRQYSTAKINFLEVKREEMKALKQAKEDPNINLERVGLDVKKALFIIQTLLQINVLEWKYLINTSESNVQQPLDEVLILEFQTLFNKVRNLRTIEIEREIEELYQIRINTPYMPMSTIHFGSRVEAWIMYELERAQMVCNQLRNKFSQDKQNIDKQIAEELDDSFLRILMETDTNFIYRIEPPKVKKNNK